MLPLSSPLQSLDLTLSCISFLAYHISIILNKYILLYFNMLQVNPTKEQMLNSTLKVTLAGTKEGILMIEGVADFLPEEVVIEALAKGHAAIGVICDAIDAFSKLGGAKPKKTETLRHFPKELLSSMDAEFGDRMQVALDTADKKKRGKACADVEKDIKQRFSVDTRKSKSKSESEF